MRPHPRPLPTTDGPASFLWGPGARGCFPPQCLCTGGSLHCRRPSTWVLRATAADTHSKAAFPAGGCFIHSLEQFPLSERPLHVRTALLSRCWNAHTQLPQAVPGPQTLARVRLRAPTQGTGSWAELPLGSLLWAVLGRTLFSSLGLPPSLPGWLGCSPGPLPGAGGTGRAGTHTVSFVPTRAPIAGA